MHPRDFSVAGSRLTRNDIWWRGALPVFVSARNEVTWQSPRKKGGDCFAEFILSEIPGIFGGETVGLSMAFNGGSEDESNC